VQWINISDDDDWVKNLCVYCVYCVLPVRRL